MKHGKLVHITCLVGWSKYILVSKSSGGIYMKNELERAINLGQLGQLDQSNKMFLQLVEQSPKDAFINYQCAMSFDVLGEESKAVPFYEVTYWQESEGLKHFG